MEETRSTSAIILSREPFRESDSLVTIYSPDLGKMFLVARGTKHFKSKLAGHIEPITIARIMAIKGRKLDYMGASTGENFFPRLKKDYSRLSLAGDMIRLFIDLLKEDDGNSDYFELLKDYLLFLDEEEMLFPLNWSIILLCLKMLALLGCQPALDNCHICGHKDGLSAFDYAAGGLVCPACSKKSDKLLGASEKAIMLARKSLGEDLENFTNFKSDSKDIKDFANICQAFYKFNFCY
jgi:DNA repair protein RecO (recombination protein O)